MDFGARNTLTIDVDLAARDQLLLQRTTVRRTEDVSPGPATTLLVGGITEELEVRGSPHAA